MKRYVMNNLFEVNQYRLKVGILGSGKIACDLLAKIIKCPEIEAVAMIGRSENSEGLKFAQSLNVAIHVTGVDAIIVNSEQFDLIFDATSSRSHLSHYQALLDKGLYLIDLTPASIGQFYVPSIEKNIKAISNHVSMVTCGGQSSLPIAHVLSKVVDANCFEVISSIAADSAGIATRENINEYLKITESALAHYTGIKNVKAVINLNPAKPPVNMQTTIYVGLNSKPDLGKATAEVVKVIAEINRYVPGYQLVSEPLIKNGNLVVMIKVEGLGDYLPKYAGNLDIITSAAVRTACQIYTNTSKEIKNVG